MPEAEFKVLMDSLKGSPQRSGEGRPQGFVTTGECGKSAPQSVNVERAADSRRPRDVVSRALRREVVQEPQASLTVGERVLGFSSALGGRMRLRPAVVAQLRHDLRGELCDARPLQEADHRQGYAQARFDRVCKLDGSQRVQAVARERLVHVYAAGNQDRKSTRLNSSH